MVTTSGRPWKETSLIGRAASLVQVESRWKRELSDKGADGDTWTQQERLVVVVVSEAARLAEMKRMEIRARSDFINGKG